MLFLVTQGLLLNMMIKETSSVFDILTNADHEKKNEKLPTTVLGMAVKDDKAVTYQELQNMFLVHMRNKMKRKTLKRKFKGRK